MDCVCVEHGYFKKGVEDCEKDNIEQWKAIDGIREDNKKTSWRVAMIVGIGIGLQTAVSLLIK
jgi:hypothetical protein